MASNNVGQTQDGGFNGTAWAIASVITDDFRNSFHVMQGNRQSATKQNYSNGAATNWTANASNRLASR
jgi:hypothetical protein